MKLKDLLKGRDKLRKYDELKEWKEHFHNMADLPMSAVPPHCIVGLPLPSHIKQIIIDAIDAEMKKLEEG